MSNKFSSLEIRNFINNTNIYTGILHVSDTSKYIAVNYIQLKCVKQYNEKRTSDRKNAGFNFLNLTQIHQLFSEIL